MNPHEKNFVEHSATQSNIKAKEINEEAQDEEEEYENREEMCDFDKFLNDMEDK